MKVNMSFNSPGTRTRSGFAWGPALSVLLCLAGCATAPSAFRESVMTSWEGDRNAWPFPASNHVSVVESSAPVRETPPDGGPGVKAPETKALPSQTISDLDLAGVTDVATVLRAMARAAGVNILVSPSVKGEISFSFQDVPWDQAFRGVIASAGLTYVWEGDVLRVLTLDDLQKELAMENARAEREKVKAEVRQVEPLVMQVHQVRYARAKPLGDILAALLGGSFGAVRDAVPGQRVYVSVDEENNAIILHAPREDLQKAQTLMQQLDRPKPQVHIEARIVEATRDTARQLGVQWGGQYATIQGNRMLTAGGAGLTDGGFVSDFPAQFAQGLDPQAGFSLGFLSEKFGGSELLSMQLSALQRSGQIKILSSPSITTLDNEKAVIESGEERAYRVTTGTGNILDVSLEWKKAVLLLEVTPHVVDEGGLRVEIVANKDSFDETRPQTNNEFPVNTKHASTTVMLRNGQTVVIGGLSQESSSDVRNGIPVLMDLPLLGHLFRNTNTASKFDDTLIFITPTILGQGQ